jgi:hypothetical protein
MEHWSWSTTVWNWGRHNMPMIKMRQSCFRNRSMNSCYLGCYHTKTGERFSYWVQASKYSHPAFNGRTRMLYLFPAIFNRKGVASSHCSILYMLPMLTTLQALYFVWMVGLNQLEFKNVKIDNQPNHFTSCIWQHHNSQIWSETCQNRGKGQWLGH